MTDIFHNIQLYVIFNMKMFFLIFRYQFYEFLSEGTYVANINMSLCFDSSGCFLQQIILKDAKLPKPLCDYNEGFPIKGIIL